ncbi:hypothetical protein CLOM_g23057 [Closterium sp. NIES-68]|nr:hypothetical protein CLOM_g23057 [Closterium sp. NIES-68]
MASRRHLQHAVPVPTIRRLLAASSAPVVPQAAPAAAAAALHVQSAGGHPQAVKSLANEIRSATYSTSSIRSSLIPASALPTSSASASAKPSAPLDPRAPSAHHASALLPGMAFRWKAVRRYSAAAASAWPPHQPVAMPSLSPTMTQGNIAKWCKAEGDQVNAGDVLCEIETDKATLSMESMEDGFLAKILMPEGSKDIPVGTPIAVMVEDSGDASKFSSFTAADAGGSAPPAAAPAPPSDAGSSTPPSDLPPFHSLAMPSLSPTMTQGNIARWRKAVGDTLRAGDVLCEIETDKATLEMEAMEDGFLAKILVDGGAKDVTVGTPIAIIVDDAESVPQFANYIPSSAPAEAASAPAAPAAAAAAAAPPPTPAAPAAPAAAAPPPPPPRADGARVFASPAARKLAADNKIDISLVSGSGPNGRVLREDVEAFLSQPRPAAAAAPSAAPTAAAVAGAPAAAPAAAMSASVDELRKRVAEQMQLSIQTVPHFYLSADAPLDAAAKVLEQLNAASDVPVTSTAILIKAAALASKKVPACNSSWAGDFIRQYADVNVAVAVFTPEGTLYPVIKAANTKGLAEIASEIQRLSTAALERTLSEADLQGATFTVSDVSGVGLKSLSAIIHPPQSCFLTIGSAQERVVPGAAAGEFAVQPYSTVTLSCDHRVVDGAVGAQWMGEFKSLVANPITLLL